MQLSEDFSPGLAGLEGNVSAQRKNTVRKRNATWMMASAVAAVTIASAAWAGTDTVPAGNATSLRHTTAGATANTPTVSLSGSTAMRNFIISPGFTFLNSTAGSSITLGATGDEITYSLGASTSLQFAQKNFNSADVTTGSFQSHSGLRVEWHEQGSVEGILELADGQINDGIYGNLIYNPTTGNATYINQNKFGGTGAATFPPGNLGGHQLNNNPNDASRDVQAQSRVQMAISDVTANQGFAKGGVAFISGGAYNKTPSQNGYGKGNPALAVGTLGTAGSRAALQDQEVLNMSAGAANPDGGTYGAGAWNTAGVGNLVSKRVAETATLFAANPGTGLQHINRTDAQWLQMAGRLKNGADFNMTTRDAGSGTRNVAALNTGVDASWAVGENDAGNGNSASGGTDQTAVGAGITFSNKTAGGGQLRPVVQRSRMAVGTLSMGDGISSFNNTNATPLRALDYRDDANDLNDNSNGAGWNNWSEDGSHNPVATSGDLAAGTFVRASAASITNGSYVIYQNEQFVTVRKPDADYATDKVKGDNSGHDVQDVRDNVLNSVVTFGSGASIATPADALIDNSFILPQLMLVNKNEDGLNQSAANAGRDVTLRQTFLGDSRAANFNPADPATIKSGAATARYGGNVAHVILNPDGTTNNVAPLGGAIPITANNYFFGDFKRDDVSPTSGNREVRDYSDLAVAQKAQAALALGGTTGWDDAGDLNSRVVSDGGGYTFTGDIAFTPNKGDLIAMGDFNSDGKFDGKDLYLMARGASLADNTSSTTLSGGSNAFADKIRTGVLRKNAALDSLQAATASATYTGATPTNSEAKQRVTASANLANDPTGANAFNKRDVNRDGNVDFVDAIASDKFYSQSYTNIDQQLAATGNVRLGETPTPFSLVDAELNDTGNIDQTDLDVINTALVGTGKENWAGSLLKTGGGAVSIGYSSGVFKVNPGAALQISSGAVEAAGSADPFTDNTGGATNGNHLSIVNNLAGSLNISAGSKSIGALSGGGKTTVSAGAALAADYIRQGQLDVSGTVTIRPNGSNASAVQMLNISAGGKFDLSDNDLIVRAGGAGTWNGSSYTGTTGLVALGRNGGTWTGSGIVTSNAPTSLTTLGVATAADAMGIGATDTAVLSGQTVTGSDTLVMYTYGGDANLDGKINVDDYTRIDFNVPLGTNGWYNGDFNYDGKINVDDYTIIDFNVNIQGAPLGSTLGSDAVVNGTAVPEPGSAGLVFCALGYSLARATRRRRR